MPEGDAVWRAARRLHAGLAGDELTRTDFRWPSLATTSLVGGLTVEVAPRGKHLLHRVVLSGRGADDGEWTIHSHLRMDGSWRVRATTTPPQRFGRHTVRAVLATERSTAVGDSLGMLDVVRTRDEATLVGHLGPDLLGPDWDGTEAAARLSRAPRTIGEALLDQRNLAGLGTLWTAETLWAQRLDPWATASALTRTQLSGLAERAHTLLTAAIRQRVPTSTGDTRPGREYAAYRQLHRPCRRCGTPITAGTIGTAPQARTLFFCPTCQS